MAFVVWGLLAACAVYWGLQGLAHPLHVAAAPVMGPPGGASDLSRLLGARPAAAVAVQPGVESRFQLLGVVAPKIGGQDGEQGLALIAVDGTPRTVRVGAVVDGDWRLRSVDRRSARIAQGEQIEATLSLAAPQAAATGSLPVPAMAGMPSPQVVPPMPAMPQQQPAEAPPQSNSGRPER